MRAFEPELVIVSAGFDAHFEDPLAGMELTGAGFRDLARRCAGLAPRVAAVLEGGYNLKTLPGLVAEAIARLRGLNAQLAIRRAASIRSAGVGWLNQAR